MDAIDIYQENLKYRFGILGNRGGVKRAPLLPEVYSETQYTPSTVIRKNIFQKGAALLDKARYNLIMI